MKAEVVQVRGITFIGKAGSGHWATMDGSPEFRGSAGASSPKELVLTALGGCTGADVASILYKMKENIQRFEISLDADVSEEHPKVFTEIRIVYKFWGENLRESNIAKAITLSQDKYCSVSAMLKPAVNVVCTHEINPKES